MSLSLGMYNFPIPDLAVGRLVETATEASGMIDAYTATTNGVVPTPTTSLVTGYDFFRDGADEVQSNLDLGIGHGGDALLADNHFNVPAPGAWTGAQMKTAVTGSRHDLIFMGGHFTANTAIAADFQTTMSATDVANSAANLQNSIVFSAGCHSGYNLLDADQLNPVTQPLDWAQAFSRKGATFIGGTGFQYGDDELVEYGERIYAEFAHQLRVGERAGLGRQRADEVEADLSRVDARHPGAPREVDPGVDALRPADAQHHDADRTRHHGHPAQLAARSGQRVVRRRVAGPPGLQVRPADHPDDGPHRSPTGPISPAPTASPPTSARRSCRSRARTSRRPAPSCAASASSAGTTRTPRARRR